MSETPKERLRSYPHQREFMERLLRVGSRPWKFIYTRKPEVVLYPRPKEAKEPPDA